MARRRPARPRPQRPAAHAPPHPRRRGGGVSPPSPGDAGREGGAAVAAPARVAPPLVRRWPRPAWGSCQLPPRRGGVGAAAGPHRAGPCRGGEQAEGRGGGRPPPAATGSGGGMNVKRLLRGECPLRPSAHRPPPTTGGLGRCLGLQPWRWVAVLSPSARPRTRGVKLNWSVLHHPSPGTARSPPEWKAAGVPGARPGREEGGSGASRGWCGGTAALGKGSRAAGVRVEKAPVCCAEGSSVQKDEKMVRGSVPREEKNGEKRAEIKR